MYIIKFYSISSPTAMLRQLKSNVGTPLADRLEILKIKLGLSKSFYSRTTHLQTKKKNKTKSDRNNVSFLPVTATHNFPMAMAII